MEPLSNFTRELQRQQRLNRFADRVMRATFDPTDPTITRAAVGAELTTDIGGVRLEEQTFVEVLDRDSITGQARADFAVAVPGDPIHAPQDEPSAAWVGEGNPIPFARVSYDTFRLTADKIAVLVAFSKEVLRLGNTIAQRHVIAVTSQAVVSAINRSFLSDDAAATGQPAGILHNVVGFGSGSPADPGSLVEELLGYVRDGRGVRLYWVASPRGVGYLAGLDANLFREVALTGGTILGRPLLVAPEAGNKLVVFDASAIGLYDNGVEVERSEVAAVQMVDNPTAGAANLVSTFQTNSSIVKVLRAISWVKLLDDAAGFAELPFDTSPA